MLKAIFAFLAAALTAPSCSLAEIQHVQGPGGASSADAPDGSPGAPWPSLEAAFRSGRIQAGDEIRLGAGRYGDLSIQDARFDGPVLIRPAEPGQVHATSVLVRASRNVVIEGLRVWPEAPRAGFLVEVQGDAESIILRDFDIRSREDASSYPGWSLEDWAASRQDGVALWAPDSSLLESRLTGLNFAVSTLGARARVSGNLVSGFSADALRAHGDDSVFEGNLVQDCVQIDDNHADGFQSWSVGPDGTPGGGVVEGLTIRGNVIYEWSSPAESPLRCDLQGIGLFDGMYRRLTIENNVVVASAHHGIEVSGGIDVRVVNNTVVNRGSPGADIPWIRVVPHKDGRPSRGVVVANNMAPQIILLEIDPSTLVESQNLVVPYPAEVLADPYGGDYSPVQGSSLIDNGDPRHATRVDILGRDRGAQPDLGAFEGPAAP